MEPNPVDDLKIILDYVIAAERNHFEELYGDESELPASAESHIYAVALRVKQALISER